jgi:hypothetical protein
MASTYSTNLGIELIGTGEQSGTWGTTTNTNLGTLLEQSIAGYATQAVTDGAATVLTITNGASSTGRNAVISLTGALTAARVVEVPAKTKTYIFANNTTGGFAVTVKVNGQTGVSIANGNKALVYCDATDVRLVVSDAVSSSIVTLTGTQTLTNKTLTTPVIDAINSTTIGATTPSTGVFTTLSASGAFTVSGVLTASGTVSGTGFSTYLASPPAIGGTTAAAGSFTALSYSTTLTGGTGVVNLGSGQFYKDASGNVGIGTSSPGYILDVVGSLMRYASTSSNGYALIQLGRSATATQNWHFGSEGDGTFNWYNGNYGSGTKRFTIGSAGQIGAGGANYGTSGQVLTSGGSGAAPSWATVSGSRTKAWARWTGSTGTIASSFNVSSITRSSAGQYIVNFTSAMADANYAPMMSCSGDVGYNGYGIFPGLTSAPTTSSFAMWTKAYNGTAADANVVQIAVIGN